MSDCKRCGGTGAYPSARWQGRCLACVPEAPGAESEKRGDELQPGDCVRSRGTWIRVTASEAHDFYGWVIRTEVGPMYGPPNTLYRVKS